MKTLKEKLNAKLSKNGGFTLVEMLIVVAIIAILVAVSIPIVGSSLDNARKAADDANVRAAKAVAVIQYLGIDTGTLATGSKTGTFNYDAAEGKLVDSTTKPTSYGQKQTGFIQVVIGNTGEVTTSWVT